MLAGLIVVGVRFYRGRLMTLERTIKELSHVIEGYSAQTVQVVSVRGDCRAGKTLGDEDMVIVSVPKEIVPEDAVKLQSAAKAKTLRIAVRSGTVLTEGMLTDSVPARDIREVEYSGICIDDNLEEGSTVDVRICYPDGRDYVVVSKNTILRLDDERKKVRFNCSEEEILLLDSAFVDALLNDGSRVYLTRYVEENLQSAAIVNYVPNDEIRELIKSNPNIVRKN